MKKYIKKILKWLIITFIVALLAVFGVNLFVKISTNKQIIKREEVTNINDIDAILVLGAAVWGNKPSYMLEDRLLEAIAIYKDNPSLKIIVSGDHGSEYYDEVNIMKKFAIDNGVPSENIFMDHAGFSTYESIYRAKEIFGVQKIVIVTQKYHLYRALYIANSLGLDAYGVSSNRRSYKGQLKREIREVLARDKDFLKCLYKPKPTYLGDVIPVSGNGDITNDK